MTDTDISLTVSHIYRAPREQVFRAWTEPEMLSQWWHMGDDGSTPIAEVDLQVGGRYRLAMKPADSDDLFIVGGTYQVVDPPEKLVYTWAWENVPDEPETTVTVDFIDHGDTTEVVINHSIFANPERRESHLEGWKGLMDQLARNL